jgi:hypothetical protein
MGFLDSLVISMTATPMIRAVRENRTKREIRVAGAS